MHTNAFGRWLLVGASLAVFACDEGAPSETKVCQGDYLISVSADMEAVKGCTEITGNLTLESMLDPTFTRIDGLEGLGKIGGTFRVARNSALTSLDGLGSLSSVGSLTVEDNTTLTSVAGLSSLAAAGTISISRNTALAMIDGLGSLKTVTGEMVIADNAMLSVVNGFLGLSQVGGGVTISGNGRLTSISGMSLLTAITGPLVITNNATLADITGFSTLAQAGKLTIDNNATLADVSGFSALIIVNGDFALGTCLMLSCTGNDALKNINGFLSLSEVAGNLIIAGNATLADLNGLNNLRTLRGSRLRIKDNTLLPLTEINELIAQVQGNGWIGEADISGNGGEVDTDGDGGTDGDTDGDAGTEVDSGTETDSGTDIDTDQLWVLINNSGPTCGANSKGIVAYDSDRGVAVMFACVGDFPGDTWEFDGGSWREIPISGPKGRDGSGKMVYDSFNKKMIMQGGWWSDDNDPWTWEYRVSGPGANDRQWVKLIETDCAYRGANSMAYDSNLHLILDFGGNHYQQFYNDTWLYDGSVNTWTWLQNWGPTRFGASLAYDNARGKFVMFGGTGRWWAGDFEDGRGNTCEFDPVTQIWTEILPQGAPGVPGPRTGAAMVYDPEAAVTILLGGSRTSDSYAYSDLWEWDGTTWREISQSSGQPIGPMWFDSALQKVVLFSSPNMYVYNRRIIASKTNRGD